MTTLLPQISWSNHLTILSQSRTAEERLFYMALCVKENYSARELSRQMEKGGCCAAIIIARRRRTISFEDFLFTLI